MTTNASTATSPGKVGGSIRLEPELDRNASPSGRLRVGLLGCLTVGSPVAKTLLEDGDSLAAASGVRLELHRVAVRHPRKERPVDLPPGLLTTNALAVAIDPDIDVVIEVIGGTSPALSLITAVLGDNKTVITANKELLAGRGGFLLEHSDDRLYFEAAVCGAVPIVRTLKEHCSGDRVEGFTGIFSGTCNFVLSEMTRSRCSLDEALAEAQRLGYAEADPSTDIEAVDAAAKVALLARVAFGVPVTTGDVDRKGIAEIDRSRIGEAASEGFVYKLVGGARRNGAALEAWVRPVLVSRDDPFARVDGCDNAVVIETFRAGKLRLHGAGAGGAPTAASVLGDLVAAARARVRRDRTSPCHAPAEAAT